jgi:hypothetical protein
VKSSKLYSVSFLIFASYMGGLTRSVIASQESVVKPEDVRTLTQNTQEHDSVSSVESTPVLEADNEGGAAISSERSSLLPVPERTFCTCNYDVCAEGYNLFWNPVRWKRNLCWGIWGLSLAGLLGFITYQIYMEWWTMTENNGSTQMQRS